MYKIIMLLKLLRIKSTLPRLKWYIKIMCEKQDTLKD